jgi:virginiamycin B lyase
MPSKRLLALTAGVAAVALYAVPVAAQNAPALTGQVTSDAEGAMEGVVVSAKKTGSTVMVSVISDA